MTNDPNTFYAIANKDNQLLSPHEWDPDGLMKVVEKKSYMLDTKKDAEGNYSET